MKIYEVNYVSYYDDFGSGGVSTLVKWIYQKKENAIAKIAEIKPEIYEKFKDKLDRLELLDKPEKYAIAEDKDYGGYIGRSVFIAEIETED